MYAEWSDSLLDSGKVYIARRRRKVAGYVACVQSSDAVTIQLLAVAPWSRGLGVGRALVRHVIESYALVCDRVQAGTQLTNTPAMALYTASGMRPVRSELSFHLWIR
ncbi:MAG: GNAT family N-acetyltransferase [Bacillota bacterium]